MDAWLRAGGLVVTASERAARGLAEAFHRARQAEGLTAWAAPAIRNWNSFVRSAWDLRSKGGEDGRLLLNARQEQAIWTGIVGESRQMTSLLPGPRHRLAGLAMEAHGLLCSFASKFIQRPAARSAWQQDAGVFSGWLTAFDETCKKNDLLSASRLPMELIALLKGDAGARPPLLLVGFDRVVPVQREVFDAWGAWRQATAGEHAEVVQYHLAEEMGSELAACAQWCSGQLAANPEVRLLVVTQDAATRRGEMERAFLEGLGSTEPLRFEFSLGVPLSGIALVKAACMVLRWFTGSLEEQELDWLLASGHTAADGQETDALQRRMLALRRRGLERTQWTLEAFISQPVGGGAVPGAWVERMREARKQMNAQPRKQSPLEWGGLAAQWLQTAGWPGGRALSSAEFQALTRWEQALDETASLGFDGKAMEWKDCLSALCRTAEETLFAPESRNAPIQIAGPAESAGLTADGIWFLGASEDAWPAKTAMNPLLPKDVQRDAGMPHATAQVDWELARTITERLLGSAREVHFSYARQTDEAETRASRVVGDLAGGADPLKDAAPFAERVTVEFEDLSRVPFPGGKVKGGAGVLSAQSNCPFKAFATARLGAQGWEPAEAGLTAQQRGKLLHAVLHSIWAGAPLGIGSLDELLKLTDRERFVAGHVARAMDKEINAGTRERMPRRYLKLEEQRLTRLVTAWLNYEATRAAFEVEKTEKDSLINLARLSLDLRLDRLDRLNDGTVLVVDYKSGDVSPKVWELPRPEDVQLPLYAGFALDKEKEALGGLVFAKVRLGHCEFAGRVGDARATLLPTLGAGTNLVKNPYTLEELEGWRACVEQLARDFAAGRAEVDPRAYPETCEGCGLQSLCRIQEHAAVVGADEDVSGEGARDE